MATIKLNLLERQRVNVLTLIALLLGMTGLSNMVLTRNHLQDDIADLQLRQEHLTRVAHLKLQSRPLPQSAPDDAKATETVARLSRSLTTPWEEMLNALQTASSANIILQKIQPDTGNNTRILVSGHASDANAFLSYIGTLEKDNRWQSVAPQSEEMDTTIPGQPLSFTLLAIWKAAP